MAKAVLKIILEDDHKQMSTENLSHLAAALNIPVPSVHRVHTIRFKLRAAIHKHADSITSAEAKKIP
jgi:hypothetical protein